MRCCASCSASLVLSTNGVSVKHLLDLRRRLKVDTYAIQSGQHLPASTCTHQCLPWSETRMQLRGRNEQVILTDASMYHSCLPRCSITYAFPASYIYTRTAHLTPAVWSRMPFLARLLNRIVFISLPHSSCVIIQPPLTPSNHSILSITPRHDSHPPPITNDHIPTHIRPRSTTQPQHRPRHILLVARARRRNGGFRPRPLHIYPPQSVSQSRNKSTTTSSLLPCLPVASMQIEEIGGKRNLTYYAYPPCPDSSSSPVSSPTNTTPARSRSPGYHTGSAASRAVSSYASLPPWMARSSDSPAVCGYTRRCSRS